MLQTIICGPSMMPSLNDGASVQIVPLSSPVSPGDIVAIYDGANCVHAPLDPSRIVVKRVIATAGQTLRIINGRIVIDGRPVGLAKIGDTWRETLPNSVSYFVLNPVRIGDTHAPGTIPDGHVWVMGDNRGQSRDSRAYGPVTLGSIIGRVGG